MARLALIAAAATSTLRAQEAPVRCPAGTDSLVSAAWRAYRADSIPLATRRFSAALTRCPRDHDANVGRAYTLLRQGAVSAADSILRAQARRTPRSLDVWEARAILAGRTGATADAVDAWRRVLILAPAHAEARAQLDRLAPGWEAPPPPVPGEDPARWRALEAVERGPLLGGDTAAIRVGHDATHLFVAIETGAAGRAWPWETAQLELAISTHTAAQSARQRATRTPGARLRAADPFQVVVEFSGPRAARIAGRTDSLVVGRAADWWYDEAAGMLELRLPWAALGVSAPSARRLGAIVTDGFRFGVAAWRPGRGVLGTVPARDDDGEWLHSRFRTWSWPTWKELTWPD